MKWMLDTNTCIYIIKQKPLKVLERLRSCRISDVGISTITLSELEYGVAKSTQAQRNKVALTEFVAPLEIFAYDDMAAQAYGDIRAHLESEGYPIGPLDTLIAAHARSIGCTLVTNNDAEFARVPGLQVENWATP